MVNISILAILSKLKIGAMRIALVGLIGFFYLLGLSGCQGQVENHSIPGASSVSIDALQMQSAAATINDQEPSISNSTVFDFRQPAKKVMPGVVHLISTFKGRTVPQRELDVPELFKDFFGDDFWHHFGNPNQPPRPVIGSGSGVIITADGYILTNNHVVEKADSIEAILNDNRSYVAKVIGTDPATDLALLKIKEQDLPFIKLGDSDQIEVGQWVLAVGNPFNLSTTVTAGIVSAKARNINIIQDQASVESFIQTDAAVNRGNSGGALVDLKGELVGINTAIASPTGAYTGYSFAIPINIAKKVVDDLLNYGEVHRAYLGVYIRNLNSSLMKELGLKNTEGVYLDSIMVGSAAAAAGLEAKDVIIEIDGEKIATGPRLQEIIARHRPNDQITIKVMRRGKEKIFKVQLKEKSSEEVSWEKESDELFRTLGIDLAELTAQEKKGWNIKDGIKVTKIYGGKIRENTDMREGFVIIRINNTPVSSISDFVKILKSTEGGVMLAGIYPDNPNKVYYYAFGL